MMTGQKQNDPGNRDRGSQAGRNMLSVIYPVVAYFAVCQIVSLLLEMSGFAASMDAVKRQGLGSLVSVAVLYTYFVHGEKKRVITAPVSGSLAAGMAVAAILLGCAGIGMNNVLALTDLMQQSERYQTVQQAFYSSNLGWEILALGIITPMAEEFVYRYLVFYRLRGLMGRVGAVVGSALIFGLIHLNIVQTVYACVLGLLLGVLMEYYQDVRVPVIGHMAANIISLLRGETGFLSWLQPGEIWFVPVTFALLAVSALIAGLHIRTFKKD